MKAATGALAFLAALSLVGCSQNGELEKARAEADAAKTELAKVKAKLDQLKAQRATEQSEENKVMQVGKEFVEHLRTKRSDKAYQLASASFQKKTFPQGLPGAAELRASDPLLNKYPTITDLEQIEHREHKLKKSSDGGGYEFFCHAREYLDRASMKARRDFNAFPPPSMDQKGTGPWIEFTLTIIQESGAWKVDKVQVNIEIP